MKCPLIVTLLIVQNCFGQKPAIGIKLGIAVSNYTVKQTNVDLNSYSPETSARTSILGGVFIDVPTGKNLIVRPGVEIVSKGAKEESNYPTKFTFVAFPLNVLFKINSTPGFFTAGGGLSVGVPIADYISQYSLRTELEVNALIGYQWSSGLLINVNYNYGLGNTSEKAGYVSKISNRYLGLAIGYSF